MNCQFRLPGLWAFCATNVDIAERKWRSSSGIQKNYPKFFDIIVVPGDSHGTRGLIESVLSKIGDLWTFRRNLGNCKRWPGLLYYLHLLCTNRKLHTICRLLEVSTTLWPWTDVTFLARDAIADDAVARCPSVTRRYSVETAKHILKLFPPSGSHTVLVFPHQTLWQYSDGDPPNWGKNRDQCLALKSMTAGADADDNRHPSVNLVNDNTGSSTSFLPRDAMHKRGLCRQAVPVRPHVRLSFCHVSVILSKRINIFSNTVHRLIATPLWFFRTKRYGNIATGTSLTGNSNACRVSKIAILDQHLASLHAVMWSETSVLWQDRSQTNKNWSWSWTWSRRLRSCSWSWFCKSVLGLNLGLVALVL